MEGGAGIEESSEAFVDGNPVGGSSSGGMLGNKLGESDLQDTRRMMSDQGSCVAGQERRRRRRVLTRWAGSARMLTATVA